MNPNRIGFGFKEENSDKELDLLQKINDRIDYVWGAVKALGFKLPDIINIRGRVTVDRVEQLPAITVSNLSEINNAIVTLGRSLASLQDSTVKAIQATDKPFPTTFSLTNPEVKVTAFGDLLDGIEELKKGFNLLLKKDFGSSMSAQGPIQVEVIKEPVRMVPQPVTNFNINPLRGFVKSSALTVGTSLAPIPATALFDRRSVGFYNNSASVTVYIGGSDVTSANGIPVGPGTYSPVVEAGPRMILYGITSSGSADCRILELSSDDVGGTQ